MSANLEMDALSTTTTKKEDSWLTHFQICQKVWLYHQCLKRSRTSKVVIKAKTHKFLTSAQCNPNQWSNSPASLTSLLLEDLTLISILCHHQCHLELLNLSPVNSPTSKASFHPTSCTNSRWTWIKIKDHKLLFQRPNSTSLKSTRRNLLPTKARRKNPLARRSTAQSKRELRLQLLKRLKNERENASSPEEVHI